MIPMVDRDDYGLRFIIMPLYQGEKGSIIFRRLF